MYKGVSRFRQALARKGRTLTSRNLVASDSAAPSPGRSTQKGTALRRRLDKEVENVTRAARAGYQRLVKRRMPPGPSN
jgi:hypothetical protein